MQVRSPLTDAQDVLKGIVLTGDGSEATFAALRWDMKAPLGFAHLGWDGCNRVARGCLWGSIPGEGDVRETAGRHSGGRRSWYS
mmetsp:Transcript_9628/g.31945  ORF Transcript_9628/g.31945 Transcript_9628/m.31945 type:complete len:84 (+) Transcript_9628:2157-2408(+)